MAFRMNSNLDALSALFNLQSINDELTLSVRRLSSGLRINSASDDPTGLVIANNYQVQADSLSQVLSNTQSSSNMVKTATGALSQISSLLSSIRSSVLSASANLTSNPTQAQSDQLTIQSAITSINNIAATTVFGNKSLLDGSAGTSAAVTNSTTIGGINFGGNFAGGVTQAGNVTITVVNAGTRAQAVGGAAATYASVNASVSTVNGLTTGSGGNVTINGQTITVSGSDTVQTLIDRINAVSASTGVSAAASTANGSTSITLNQSNYGANYRIVSSESAALVLGTSGTTVAGLNATVTVSAATLISGTVSYATVTFVGGRGSSDSGLRVTDTYGNSILLTEAGNTTATVGAGVGSITSNPVSFQIGTTTNNAVSVTFPNVFPSRLGASAVSGENLSTIDVTTQQGINEALLIVDEAVAQVSRYQAELGGFEKHVLQSAMNVMNSNIESLNSSISRIMDVDVAAESNRLTWLQTIQQAGVSALRAAQNTQSIYLRLLQ